MNVENCPKNILNIDSVARAKMGELGLQFVEQFEMSRVLEKFYDQIRTVVSNAEIEPEVTGDCDGDA